MCVLFTFIWLLIVLLRTGVPKWLVAWGPGVTLSSVTEWAMSDLSGLPWVYSVLRKSLSDALTLCCLFSHFVSLKLPCLSSGPEGFLPFLKKAAGFSSLKCLPFPLFMMSQVWCNHRAEAGQGYVTPGHSWQFLFPACWAWCNLPIPLLGPSCSLSVPTAGLSLATLVLALNVSSCSPSNGLTVVLVKFRCKEQWAAGLFSQGTTMMLSSRWNSSVLGIIFWTFEEHWTLDLVPAVTSLSELALLLVLSSSLETDNLWTRWEWPHREPLWWLLVSDSQEVRHPLNSANPGCMEYAIQVRFPIWGQRADKSQLVSDTKWFDLLMCLWRESLWRLSKAGLRSQLPLISKVGANS